MRYEVLSARLAGAAPGDHVELDETVNVAALVAAGIVRPLRKRKGDDGPKDGE